MGFNSGFKGLILRNYGLRYIQSLLCLY